MNWILELFDYMPVEGSSWAGRVDWINNLITAISVFCIFAITAVMLFFAWKYRRKSPDQKTAYITHNATIETIWTVIPTIVCMFMFYFGYEIYHEMRNPPVGAREVNVEGFSWGWNFQYENGKKTSGELVVPVGEPVKLIMTSKDVIHSFFIPAMRVKEDVYNGNYSFLWFTPTSIGDFRIFCTEYCGTSHSQMLANLKVVSKEAFDDYVNDKTAEDAPKIPPAELGKKLYAQKACVTCHSLDGSKLVGPSFKGIFSNTPHEFEDGTSGVVDENYIKESVMYPQKKVVKGYPPVMPAFEGQLNDEEMAGIIAYMKTL